MTPRAKAPDHDCLQLDLDVFDGFPARFAHGEQRVREMFAISAAEHQLGRTAVHEFTQREVLDADFSAAGATAYMGRTIVRHPP